MAVPTPNSYYALILLAEVNEYLVGSATILTAITRASQDHATRQIQLRDLWYRNRIVTPLKTEV
jgi:hypothetical protein